MLRDSPNAGNGPAPRRPPVSRSSSSSADAERSARDPQARFRWRGRISIALFRLNPFSSSTFRDSAATSAREEAPASPPSPICFRIQCKVRISDFPNQKYSGVSPRYAMTFRTSAGATFQRRCRRTFSGVSPGRRAMRISSARFRMFRFPSGSGRPSTGAVSNGRVSEARQESAANGARIERFSGSILSRLQTFICFSRK